MNITNESSKPVRLRFFDKSSNTKIILDVCWKQLKGNKLPYLSTSLQHVKVNGVVCNTWESSIREQLKELVHELHTLLNSHLNNIECYPSNVLYHFQLAKEQFGKKVFTQEDYNKLIIDKNTNLENHQLFKTLKILRLLSYNQVFMGMVKDVRSGKFYKGYKFIDRLKDSIKSEIYRSDYSRKIGGSTISDIIDQFFRDANEIQELISKYKYKTLPNKSDLWNVSRLVKTYNLSELEVFKILSSTDLKTTLSPMLEIIQNNTKNSLQVLTDKYKIPLVKD